MLVPFSEEYILYCCLSSTVSPQSANHNMLHWEFVPLRDEFGNDVGLAIVIYVLGEEFLLASLFEGLIQGQMEAQQLAGQGPN